MITWNIPDNKIQLIGELNNGRTKDILNNSRSEEKSCTEECLFHSISDVDDVVDATLGDFDHITADFFLPSRKRKIVNNIKNDSNERPNEIFDSNQPNCKKSKNLNSITRSGKSFVSIEGSLVSVDTPRISSSTETGITETTPITSVPKSSSLLFQLHCVSTASDADVNGVFNFDVSHVQNTSTPHLHVTVSNSSCSSNNSQISKAPCVISTPLRKNTEFAGQGYGWFVEVDNDTADNEAANTAANNCYQNSDRTTNLTFQASSLGNTTKQTDLELEWACAADTVDDALGDFF